jgi:hypothetical protein
MVVAYGWSALKSIHQKLLLHCKDYNDGVCVRLWTASHMNNKACIDLN